MTDNYFNKIAGYKNIKEEAYKIIDMINNIDLYKEKGARLPRGWMFTGKPGVGKTLFVNTIAEATNTKVFRISDSEALNKNITLKELIIDAFKNAKLEEKSIIFVDEIDKIAGYHKNILDKPENLDIQRLLMNQMDMIKDDDNIFFFSTANERTLLFKPFLRTGRFDRIIVFNDPSSIDREEIINYYTRNSILDDDVIIDSIVSSTSFMSCSDIECIINEAILSSISRRSEKVSAKDFDKAIKRVMFKDIEKEISVDDDSLYSISIHESGHGLVSYLLNKDEPVTLSIIPQGDTSGATFKNVNDKILLDKEKYDDLIKISLGGVCALKIMNMTLVGNYDDYSKAYEFAYKELREGFYGPEYALLTLYDDNFDEKPSIDFKNDKDKKLIEIIKKEYDSTCEMITRNKDLLLKLADNLMKKKELTYYEVKNILK